MEKTKEVGREVYIIITKGWRGKERGRGRVDRWKKEREERLKEEGGE